MKEVVVPAKVLEGLKAVKDSGALNMFDFHGVVAMAESLGFSETVTWMQSHKVDYSVGIFHGFIPAPDTSEHLN